MGVDGGLADPKGTAELATEENNKYSSKKKKRRQKKPASTPSAVQRLFETCKEVFAHGGRGFIPSADDVERLRSVLGQAIWVSSESKEYAWLEERESKPDDLVVRGAEYRGPKIVGR
ncbi:hypothetical protein BHE74_00050524 [Ensete ventricosum]|nr:hypothetical protein GW17_00051500 [Ensete ventricosum]RWW43779.1 hypothetical protein BHE74_00050524 [Ensete ventricosum]RZS00842.1 hypothetical protein BHM03_00030616 [Ensete ventricosum]